MIQIATGLYNSTNDINEALRLFQKQFPNRQIVNVSINEHEPAGWFVTITYDVNLK